MNKIGLVISREYRERVGKKSFIITTLLMPVFMLVMMVAPAMIMQWSGTERVEVMVIDNSGLVADRLVNGDEAEYVIAPPNATMEQVMGDSGAINAVLVIPPNVADVKRPTLHYYSNGPSAMNVEVSIRSQVNDIVRTIRLERNNIADIDSILAEAECDAFIQTIRTDRDEDSQTDSELSFGLGIGLTLILYMFLLLYGQMVMTSIIEEKNNRVLEVMVSSVRPWQLMLGKITGIALVAVTQILIWGILLTLMSALLLPAVLPADALADIAAVKSGNFSAVSDPDALGMVQTMSRLTDVGWIIGLMGQLTLFLIGGFFFYSAIYAAIGSAVDNIQDAGQLQTVIILPVIVGLVCAMAAAADPNTPLAFWLSLIPFTSPMVMMARIPFGIPAWEVWVSLALLYISFFGMVWIAAKVYRVGIFMYGKKPTLKELWRWVKYK